MLALKEFKLMTQQPWWPQLKIKFIVLFKAQSAFLNFEIGSSRWV